MTTANHNTLGAGRHHKTPMNSAMAALRHRGYEDARQGLGFPREYDGWSHNRQMNYERGRQQWALVHRAAGGTEKDMLHTVAPKWRRNMYLERVLQKAGAGRETLKAVFGPTGLETFNDMTYAAYLQWFAVGKAA